MLGTIAKKLRIFGFDCTYSSTIEDDDLILIAKKQNRIVITKDSKLANNARKHDILTVEITTHAEKEQFVEIAKKMGWTEYQFDVTNARCAVCNGILQTVQKSQIVDKVSPKIAQNIKEFWICSDCKHIYWEGTHIRKLEKLIAEINDQL
jgi:hypothetical protein